MPEQQPFIRFIGLSYFGAAGYRALTFPLFVTSFTASPRSLTILFAQIYITCKTIYRHDANDDDDDDNDTVYNSVFFS